MGLLDAYEHDGGDVDELEFLAKTWREQEKIKREQDRKEDMQLTADARFEIERIGEELKAANADRKILAETVKTLLDYLDDDEITPEDSAMLLSKARKVLEHR